jgi:hypothetical protein
VEQLLSYQARCALLQQAVPKYREASPSQKRTLLDAYEEWKETRPGFLEADLVAHYESKRQEIYLHKEPGHTHDPHSFRRWGEARPHKAPRQCHPGHRS